MFVQKEDQEEEEEMDNGLPLKCVLIRAASAI